MDKAEIRREWVRRLRSGEIKQTREVLGRADGSRCCLGVLCDIAVEQGLISAPTMGFDNSGNTCLEFPETGKYALGPLVDHLAGLTDEVGRFISGTGPRQSLAYLNDNGATFNQIADIIESEPEGLFV